MRYRILPLLLTLVLCAELSGCSGFASMAETLHARQVKSCLYYEGFAGGSWPGVPQMRVRGVTATGGVEFETCLGVGPH